MSNPIDEHRRMVAGRIFQTTSNLNDITQPLQKSEGEELNEEAKESFEPSKRHNLRKSFDVLGLKTDLEEMVDIVKSDIAYSFDGQGSEKSIEIPKKGSEIKEMAQQKLISYQSKHQSLLHEKEEVKEELEEAGIEFIQGEYDERPSYDYSEIEHNKELASNINKYQEMMWQCREMKSDIKVLEVLVSSIEDNKTYKLSVRQIASLK